MNTVIRVAILAVIFYCGKQISDTFTSGMLSTLIGIVLVYDVRTRSLS
jgi:putative effector of murein hydrolase LrgA (UPF0299 family)